MQNQVYDTLKAMNARRSWVRGIHIEDHNGTEWFLSIFSFRVAVPARFLYDSRLVSAKRTYARVVTAHHKEKDAYAGIYMFLKVGKDDWRSIKARTHPMFTEQGLSGTVKLALVPDMHRICCDRMLSEAGAASWRSLFRRLGFDGLQIFETDIRPMTDFTRELLGLEDDGTVLGICDHDALRLEYPKVLGRRRIGAYVAWGMLK